MNIVTGFVSRINNRADRDLSKYIVFGMELMSVEIPITVFIERWIFDQYVSHKLSVPMQASGEFLYSAIGGVMDGMQRRYSYVIYGHVRFVFFEKTDLFLWPYKSMAARFSLNTGNPGKDTLEYMMVQCQKSEWAAISLQLLHHLSVSTAKEHVWVDFGAFHMFKGKIDVFQIELYKMRNRANRRILQSGESPRVQFARCWDPNHPYVGDIYRDVNWSFAGSVFGGGAAAIQTFALYMREKCFQILREKNTIMWEINLWLLIYREHPELFALYPSDHSEILFLYYV
jgi:hypothetical protein